MDELTKLLSLPFFIPLITFLAGIIGAYIGGRYALEQTRLANENAARLAEADRNEDRRKDAEAHIDKVRRETADFYLEILRPLRKARRKMEFWHHHNEPDYQEFQEALGWAKSLILTIPDPTMQSLVVEWENHNNDEKLSIIDQAIKWLGQRVYEVLLQEAGSSTSA